MSKLKDIETTTIAVSKEVRARIKALGKKGEKYNDVLERLLNEVETA